MKVALASVAASALIACGGPSGADATVYIDPPLAGDNSCIGVAGFEVIISPADQAAQSTALVGPAPVLDAKACVLPQPFTIQDLNVDAAVTVTIRGYDGTGTASRVSATKTVPSLRESPVHLALQAAMPPPPPLLVVYRNALLQGTPISAVSNMVVSIQMQAIDILSVDRSTAGPYLDPEPGAYGIPTGLAADGRDDGLALSVSFTAPGRMIKGRLTARWNGVYYEAR